MVSHADPEPQSDSCGNVKIFATKVGVTITMAACGENVSAVVKKDALWDNTSISRRALKAK